MVIGGVANNTEKLASLSCKQNPLSYIHITHFIYMIHYPLYLFSYTYISMYTIIIIILCFIVIHNHISKPWAKHRGGPRHTTHLGHTP